MRKDADVQGLPVEISEYWGNIFPNSLVASRSNFTYLWKYHPIRFPETQYKSFIDVYNCIFKAILHKITHKYGNLPETFWGDKFQAYFCGNFHRLSTIVEIYQEFPHLFMTWNFPHNILFREGFHLFS